MAKIIGNTTATPNPRPDWNQTDETKADYIKNKPTVLTEEDVVGLIADNTEAPTEQIQSDWNQTDETQLDYIKNKPTLIDNFSEGENGELLYNGDSIGGGLDAEYAEQIEANTEARHTHTNKEILDKFTEVDGTVLYNNEQIAGVGESGATFTPSVSEEGDLSWSNDKGLDNPATVNIKGDRGVSGVYVGSGDMPEGYNIQIDPNGEAITIPEEGYTIDTTLTQAGSAADAKATGDRLLGVEYQFVTTEVAYEHKDLLEGEKTVTVQGDGTWGDTAYVCTGEDLIPRQAFNKTFPYNGVTVTRGEKIYHIEGTSTTNFSINLAETLSNIYLEAPENIIGKSFKLIASSNITTEKALLVGVSFRDSNKAIVQVKNKYGALANQAVTYFSNTTPTVAVPFTIPETFTDANGDEQAVEIATMLIYLTVSTDVTFDNDFQFFIVADEQTQEVTSENPAAIINNAEISDVFTFPYQSIVGIKAPIVEYIKYLAKNTEGDKATYLMPETFGAIGDGYANDSEAIAACLEVASETKQVVLMAKKYLITSPIVINADGLNLIINDIVYNGTDSAIKINSSKNMIKIHSIVSSGKGISIEGDAVEKSVVYNNIDVNTINAASHGITFVCDPISIWQNTVRFNLIRAGGVGCYGIAYLNDRQNGKFVTENNFYGGHISNCEWAVYGAAGNSKYYGLHIEGDVQGGFYIKSGCQIFHPRIEEAQRDGNLPIYKLLETDHVNIYDSTGIYINQIDLSEAKEFVYPPSGIIYPKLENAIGVINGRIYSRNFEDGGTITTSNVYTTKAYVWGKRLIMTPYMSYRKVVTTDTLDLRTVGSDATPADVRVLTQLPTKFVVDSINSDIYLHESYCAFGYNEFEVEQKNGFACKIHGITQVKNEDGTYNDDTTFVIFDGANYGDGVYKFKVYKDSDICKQKSLGILLADFTGHYWNVEKVVDESDIPTKTSELENDSGFITVDDIPESGGDFDLSDYYTKTEIDSKGFVTAEDLLGDESVNLSNYYTKLESDEIFAKKSDIPIDESYELIGQTPLTLAEKSNIKLVANGETTYEAKTPTVWNFDDFFANGNYTLTKCTFEREDDHYKVTSDDTVTAHYQSFLRILIPVEIGKTYTLAWDNTASKKEHYQSATDWGGYLAIYSGEDTSTLLGSGILLDNVKSFECTPQHNVLHLRYCPASSASVAPKANVVGRFNAMWLNEGAATELTEPYSVNGTTDGNVVLQKVPKGATITATPTASVHKKAPTDKTLTKADTPADGQATGERIEAVKNLLPLYGKTIVNFGDSIFGNAQPPVDISTFLAEKTGATVYNCGFGGCRMTPHPTSWYDAFSMYRIADSITSRNFTVQDEAVASGNLAERYSVGLERLKSIDFSKVDIVTIAYGTNDFNGYGAELDNEENNLDINSFGSALRYSIETILATYPNVRIFVLSTTWNFSIDSENNYTEDSNTRTNAGGQTIQQYNEKLKEVAAEYNLPFIDDYNIGIGKHNRSYYFNANDGAHHKEAGRRLIAAHLAKKLY